MLVLNLRPTHADQPKPLNLLTLNRTVITESSLGPKSLSRLRRMSDGHAATTFTLSKSTGRAVDVVYSFGGQTVAPQEVVIQLAVRRSDNKPVGMLEVMASSLDKRGGFQSLRSDVLKSSAKPQRFRFSPVGAKRILVRISTIGKSHDLAIAEIAVRGYIGPPETHYRFKQSPAKAFEVLAQLQKTARVRISSDEAELFRDARDGKLDHFTFAEAALMASGVTDRTKRSTYMRRLSVLEAQARQQLASAKTPAQRGELLLKWLHAGEMKAGYRSNQTLVSCILDDNTFNCVSSAALYNILGRRLGLDLRAIEVPDHAFSILYVGTKHYDVETTTRNGFAPSRNPAVLKELQQKKGFRYIPERNRAQRREVDELGLAAIIYYNRGVTFMKAKQHNQALVAFFCALSLDAEFASAVKNVLAELVNWSGSLAKAGQYEDALRVIGTGLRLAPKDAKLNHNHKVFWTNWSLSEIDAGNVDRALRILRKAEAAIPGGGFAAMQSRVFTRPGEKLAKSGKWSAAIALTNRGLKLVNRTAAAELNDYRVGLYLRWGNAELQRRRFDQATDALAKGFAAAPNNRKIVNNLSYVAREWTTSVYKKQGFAAALSVAGQLRKQFPKLNGVRKSVGSFVHQAVYELQKQGKYTDALSAAKKGERLLNDVKVAKAMQAAVYDAWARSAWTRKDYDAALKIYRQGLKAMPGHSRLVKNAGYVWNLKGMAAIKAKNWSVRRSAIGDRGEPQSSLRPTSSFAATSGFTILGVEWFRLDEPSMGGHRMSQALTCLNGHEWEAADGESASSCPICGSKATIGEWNDETQTRAASSEILPPPPRLDQDAPSRQRASSPLSESEGSLPEQFGRYRILDTLGKGGMGAVYLAHDTQLDRRVALKVPHFSPLSDPVVFERFAREARAAATLDHPNICSVYDVGEIEGTHYLTMAYIEGQTLAQLMRGNEKPLGQQGVADLIRKLALALDEAHSRGVIHRDLKPANVMINQRFEPVIMDFGLARREGCVDSKLTAEGALMGTPAYMAPEQVAGEQDRIGPATDVYALGVILYEMLTGRVPFTGSMGEILAQVATETPAPLSEFRPDVDSPLAEICLKALNKPIDQRYSSMGEFADALGAYLNSSPNNPAQAMIDVDDEQAAATGSPGAVDRSQDDSLQLAAKLLASLAARIDSGELTEESVLGVKRQRPWWIWAIGGTIAAVLIAVAIIPLLKTPEPPQAPVNIRIEQYTQYVNAVYILDGKEVSREELAAAVKLPVGPHELLVKQDGKVIARKTFEVTTEHVGKDAVPISITPEPVEDDPPKIAGQQKSGGIEGKKRDSSPTRSAGVSGSSGNTLPKFAVDSTLEIWGKKYSSSRVNPLHTKLLVNGAPVDTFEDNSQWTIAGKIREGTWNKFELLTSVHQPVKGSNYLSFGVGPVSKTTGGERMFPVIWNFNNGDGWELKDGKYRHRGHSKSSAPLTFYFYFGNLKNESREPKNDDYVISGRGANTSRNPSVTATIFVNGTPLTTFSSTPRRAVVTDLLKPGYNTIRLVTHRVEGSLADNDIQIRMSGPVAGSDKSRRGLLWMSALTGWRRNAEGKFTNADGADSIRLDREITLYLPDPIKPGAARARLPEIMAFARRDSQGYENSLHSEIRVRQGGNGQSKLAARFTSDSSANLDGLLRRDAWNELTIRTISAEPPASRANALRIYFGRPQLGRSGDLTMPRAVWILRNNATSRAGISWKPSNGKLLFGKAREVEHTFHVYLAGAAHEKRKPMKGDYALICDAPPSGRVPSVTATVFVNGTPLTSFLGAQRTVILRPPLIKPGVNEIRLVTKRVENCQIDGDFRFTIAGPAESASPRYPRIKQFTAMKGWVRDAGGTPALLEPDPKALLVPAEMSRRFGLKEDELIAHCRDQIDSATYPGILRGGYGALWTGTGNIWDRTVLAAEALKGAGTDAQILPGDPPRLVVPGEKQWKLVRLDTKETEFVDARPEGAVDLAGLRKQHPELFHRFHPVIRLHTTSGKSVVVSANSDEFVADWLYRPVVLAVHTQADGLHYSLNVFGETGARNVLRTNALENVQRAELELTWRYGETARVWKRELFDRANADETVPGHAAPRAGDRYAITTSLGPLSPEVLATRAEMSNEQGRYTPLRDEISRNLVQMGTRYFIDSDEHAKKLAEQTRVRVSSQMPRLAIVAYEPQKADDKQPDPSGFSLDIIANDVEAVGERAKEFQVARGFANDLIESHVLFQATKLPVVSAATVFSKLRSPAPDAPERRIALIRDEARRMLAEEPIGTRTKLTALLPRHAQGTAEGTSNDRSANLLIERTDAGLVLQGISPEPIASDKRASARLTRPPYTWNKSGSVVFGANAAELAVVADSMLARKKQCSDYHLQFEMLRALSWKPVPLTNGCVVSYRVTQKINGKTSRFNIKVPVLLKQGRATGKWLTIPAGKQWVSVSTDNAGDVKGAWPDVIGLVAGKGPTLEAFLANDKSTENGKRRAFQLRLGTRSVTIDATEIKLNSPAGALIEVKSGDVWKPAVFVRKEGLISRKSGRYEVRILGTDLKSVKRVKPAQWRRLELKEWNVEGNTSWVNVLETKNGKSRIGICGSKEPAKWVSNTELRSLRPAEVLRDGKWHTAAIVESDKRKGYRVRLSGTDEVTDGWMKPEDVRIPGADIPSDGKAILLDAHRFPLVLAWKRGNTSVVLDRITPVVTGKVTDSRTGLPVAGAVVSRSDGRWSVKTAADGAYGIPVDDPIRPMSQVVGSKASKVRHPSYRGNRTFNFLVLVDRSALVEEADEETRKRKEQLWQQRAADSLDQLLRSLVRPGRFIHKGDTLRIGLWSYGGGAKSATGTGAAPIVVEEVAFPGKRHAVLKKLKSIVRGGKANLNSAMERLSRQHYESKLPRDLIVVLLTSGRNAEKISPAILYRKWKGEFPVHIFEIMSDEQQQPSQSFRELALASGGTTVSFPLVADKDRMKQPRFSKTVSVRLRISAEGYKPTDIVMPMRDAGMRTADVSLNAACCCCRKKDESNELLVVTNKNTKDLSRCKGLSRKARRLIEDRVADGGWTVTIPTRRVNIAGITAYAWYESEIATGRLIGRTEDGLHGAVPSPRWPGYRPRLGASHPYVAWYEGLVAYTAGSVLSAMRWHTTPGFPGTADDFMRFVQANALEFALDWWGEVASKQYPHLGEFYWAGVCLNFELQSKAFGMPSDACLRRWAEDLCARLLNAGKDLAVDEVKDLLNGAFKSEWQSFTKAAGDKIADKLLEQFEDQWNAGVKVACSELVNTVFGPSK
eukprot:g8263.t1